MKKIVLLAVVLAGCATSQSESERVYAEYKGKPVQRLMQFWGTPSRHVSNTIGKLYIWVDQPVARGCQMEVQADEFEHLEGIRSVGNGEACTRMLQMVKHQ